VAGRRLEHRMIFGIVERERLRSRKRKQGFGVRNVLDG
jgi:hypothetical protein